MTRHIGVVTSVHDPDDTRIHHKLVPTLSGEFAVTLVARPGHADGEAVAGETLDIRELRGGRLRRMWGAFRHMRHRGYDVVVVHDPELLPAALVCRLLRRRVVFDMHEDVPAQMRDKAWVWPPLRPLLSWLMLRLLRVAERTMPITLAEGGYHRRLRRRHPVFPNYLRRGSLPSPAERARSVVYVGDISEHRGALDLITACSRIGDPPPVTMVGPVSADLAAALTSAAEEGGVPLRLTGRLSYRLAWQLAAGAGVGVVPLRAVSNYRHSLPTKALEYLAVGVPVVASDLPGTRSAIEGLPGVVLATPGDADAWATAIGTALDDAAVGEAAAANHDGVYDAFPWPEDEVLEFYRRLSGD